MPQIETVMLIDDNDADNFYHKIVMQKAGFSGDIIVFQYAYEALAFLKKNERIVDLILLDINMPRMNGFEFLEAYEALPSDQRVKAIVIMLTTSLNPADEARANEFADVRGFLNKPLTSDSFSHLVGEIELE